MALNLLTRQQMIDIAKELKMELNEYLELDVAAATKWTNMLLKQIEVSEKNVSLPFFWKTLGVKVTDWGQPIDAVQLAGEKLDITLQDWQGALEVEILAYLSEKVRPQISDQLSAMSANYAYTPLDEIIKAIKYGDGSTDPTGETRPSQYLSYDGKYWLATDHPVPSGDTYSNKRTEAFGESGLTEVIRAFSECPVGARGKKVNLIGNFQSSFVLAVGVENYIEAMQWKHSTSDPTASNDATNIINFMGMIADIWLVPDLGDRWAAFATHGSQKPFIHAYHKLFYRQTSEWTDISTDFVMKNKMVEWNFSSAELVVPGHPFLSIVFDPDFPS